MIYLQFVGTAFLIFFTAACIRMILLFSLIQKVNFMREDGFDPAPRINYLFKKYV